MGAVIGIDWGERRVGVAVSDPEGIIALPVGVLDGRDPAALAAEIATIVRERDAERVVVGLPRNMDGSLGPIAEAVLRFRELLSGVLDVPIETWDERLSSAQAERLLREADDGGARPGERRRRRHRGGTPPKRKEKSRVDRIAAVLILQSWLDRRGGEGG